MRSASGSNADRSRFTAQELELAAILRDWNPVGYPAGGAGDEYDDLVRPVLIDLGHGPDARALAVELADVLTHDYGLAIREQQARAAASTIVDWWARQPDVV